MAYPACYQLSQARPQTFVSNNAKSAEKGARHSYYWAKGLCQLKGNPMKRVMIIGGSGSGKSTLARRLGNLTGIPVIHMDPMYYKPGWIMRPKDVYAQMSLDALKGKFWIFEGNLSSTMAARLDASDVFIFLDIGTTRRLWRVIWRTIRHYGKPRPDMASGCPERFEWAFLKFVAGYNRRGRVGAFEILRLAKTQHKWYHVKTNAGLDQLFQDALHRARH